jgi:polyhydroxybutyrate depolymerase
MAKSTLFSPLADEYEYIVVYPDGYEKSWNDGRGEGPAAEEGIDDVQFIETLIDEIQKEYTIDSKKIYATGMSNGGFMAMRLACELDDKIAAFSSVTGSLSDQYNCEPSRSVPILLIAGTDDELVPYEGGEVANSGTTSLAFDSLLGFWGANNDCSNFEITALPSTKDDGTQIEKMLYSNCENDKSCLLFKVINGGHTWPSGESFFGSDVVGLTSTEIMASREIVEFSLSHELDD